MRKALPYFGAMLTMCIFGGSNYLWQATSWWSSNIVRQSSVISVPQDNDHGNMKLVQHVNASTRSAYISKIMKKFLYAQANNSRAIRDITARGSALSSKYALSSPTSSSCATANEAVLNMGNRTRLGTGEKILLVGLAKAGTTSVGGFFQRAGYNTCDFQCRDIIFNVPTLACCMWQAQQEHKPLLASCGGDEIEMYAQMDTMGWPENGFCFFPQINALDDLHGEHPNATFILNMRQVRYPESIIFHVILLLS
jgi:hypothetical protein